MKQNPIISLSLRKYNYRFYYNFLKVFLFVFLFLLTGSTQTGKAQIIRKTLVEFFTSDSLLITADHYFSRVEDPYILLFHQENSSRAEFDSIAERFIKMRYNCLAVDMRIGGSYNFINNQTASRAREKNMVSKRDAEKDIHAAISYISRFSDDKVILLGSSLSATLVLKAASSSEKVAAVMAFSPGEYLRPQHSLRSILEKISCPVYITCSPVEYPYLIDALSSKTKGDLSFFEPPGNTTERGVSLLMDENPTLDEYWFSVLIFIKSLQM